MLHTHWKFHSTTAASGIIAASVHHRNIQFVDIVFNPKWGCIRFCLKFNSKVIPLSLQDCAAFAKRGTKLSSLTRRPLPVNNVLLTNLYVHFIFSVLSCFSHHILRHIRYLTPYAALLQAVTLDGFGCIRCPGSLSDEGKCRCPEGDILGESLSHQEKHLFKNAHNTI